MNISDFDYPLPEGRIAKFPAAERDAARLLVWRGGEAKREAEEDADGAGEASAISETVFKNIGDVLPPDSTLVFNDTRVVRARLAMFRRRNTDFGGNGRSETGYETNDGPSSRVSVSDEVPQRGARIEVLCLEPHDPADYERAFAARGRCEWRAMIGGAKKWKSGPIEIRNENGEILLTAWRCADQESATQHNAGHTGDLSSLTLARDDREEIASEGKSVATVEAQKSTNGEIVRFEWAGDETFGQKLEQLGRVPIPPYLDRDTQEIDSQRYQTVYAAIEGSVAAPTAGLHFTPELIAAITEPQTGQEKDLPSERPSGEARVKEQNRSSNEASGPLSRQIERVTLHVGAGTFLPVKTENALAHPMHTEHFEVSLGTIERLAARLRTGKGGQTGEGGRVIAVGTTSVRTLESLAVLGWRLACPPAPLLSKEGKSDEAWEGCGRDFANEALFWGSDCRDRLGLLVGQFAWREMPEDFSGVKALENLARWMRAQGMETLRGATRIMITPGYKFRIVGGLITNFHQPKSTLLLLVSAFTGGRWREIYDYALAHDFRFLSYGDSSLLLP